MRNLFKGSALGSSLVLIGALTACGGSSAPTQPTTSSPASSRVALTTLRVDGPATLAPGASAQYKATAVYADGSSLDVTNQAQWSSTNGSVLSVTAAALATGRSNGDATLTAAFGTRSQVRDVIVVPTGLYMVRVFASEDQENARLNNVLVQVISGPSAGLAATTDWDGIATLFGVPQDAQLRYTKDGYVPLVQSVHLDGNSDQILAQLIPSAGRLDLAGQYQLTIDCSTCSGTGMFPPAARMRTYAASIQNSANLGLAVNLSGANFALGTCPVCGGETRGNGFAGQTEAADGRFTLIAYAVPWDFNTGIYPNVVESLGDGTFLTISGQAIVTPTPNGFAGTMDGAFAIYRDFDTYFQGSQPVAMCSSNAIPFVLARPTAHVGR